MEIMLNFTALIMMVKQIYSYFFIIVILCAMYGCTSDDSDKNNYGLSEEDYEFYLRRPTGIRYVFKTKKSIIQKQLFNILTIKYDEIKVADTKESYFIETKTIEYTENNIKRRKYCYVDVQDLNEDAVVHMGCHVKSYWTRWNNPPMHTIGDFVDWNNDWYYDEDKSIVEDIRILSLVIKLLNLSDDMYTRYVDVLEFDKFVQQLATE